MMANADLSATLLSAASTKPVPGAEPPRLAPRWTRSGTSLAPGGG